MWRHQTAGITALTAMTATTPGLTTMLPAVDPSWELIGTPDITDDGKPDIVWRRTSDGLTYVWMMDGTTPVGAAALVIPPGTTWRAVSFADVNNDGKPDLVFREQVSGTDLVLYQNGTVPTGAALLPTVADTTLSIVGPR
jgi:hypothetical protein